MRALIGRAHEDRATVELELMSSTSHEVCELWNGQRIVRTIGVPKIRQIIFLEDYKSNESCGLFRVEEAVAAGVLRGQSIFNNNCKIMI